MYSDNALRLIKEARAYTQNTGSARQKTNLQLPKAAKWKPSGGCEFREATQVWNAQRQKDFRTLELAAIG
jgi:hypothetical protein